MNTLTQETRDKIKHDMVYGYYDDNGKKQYPSLKAAAEWYDVSYDSLKQYAKDWRWKQKRKDHQARVHRKVAEKKKSEELSESEAEEIVVDDAKFNKAACKLRRATVLEIEKIIDGKIYLYSLKDGTSVYGTPRNATYMLMNAGKALESAQKISKTAAGEPSEISKVEGKEPVDEFNRIMDESLDNLDDGPVEQK